MTLPRPTAQSNQGGALPQSGQKRAELLQARMALEQQNTGTATRGCGGCRGRRITR